MILGAILATLGLLPAYVTRRLVQLVSGLLPAPNLIHGPHCGVLADLATMAITAT